MPATRSIPVSGPRTLNVTFARVLVSQLKQSRPELMPRLGPSSLRYLDERDPLARCTLAEWHALLDEVEALLGSPDLVPQLAEHFKPWHAGLLGFTLMTSGTVVELARLLRRFHHLLNDVFEVQRGLDGPRFLLRLVPVSAETSHRLARLSLAVWAQRLRWLTGRPDLTLDASFEGPAPLDVAPYRRIFGGTVRFDQVSNTMWGDASFVDLPIVSHDTASHTLLQAQALKQLEQLSRGEDSVVARVRGLISRRLDSGQLSLEDIASELKLPARTMQRRLDEAGAPFRLMVDEVRKEQAQRYLRDTAMPLSELAVALGFSDHASFNRAFKRWMGCSPGAFRREQAAQAGGAAGA